MTKLASFFVMTVTFHSTFIVWTLRWTAFPRGHGSASGKITITLLMQARFTQRTKNYHVLTISGASCVNPVVQTILVSTAVGITITLFVGLVLLCAPVLCAKVIIPRASL